jgi:hypothetical protein
MASSAKRVSGTVIDVSIQTKVITAAAEATTGTLAAMSDSVEAAADTSFNNIAHIGFNFREMHRKFRLMFSPPKPLGSLTEEKANSVIQSLTLDEAKEISLAYKKVKESLLKPKADPKGLSQTTLDDALLAATDENRAKIIIAFVFNLKAQGSDLSYVCVDFLRRKIGLDFDLQKESKFTPTTTK